MIKYKAVLEDGFWGYYDDEGICHCELVPGWTENEAQINANEAAKLDIAKAVDRFCVERRAELKEKKARFLEREMQRS